MRHRVSGRHFNRDTKQRQALLKGLVRSFLETGSITTTKEKAWETQRLSEKLISQAKSDSVATRRQLHRFFGKRDVVNTLVDEIAPSYQGVNSGFTTLVILGPRRGDNAMMAQLSLTKPRIRAGFAKPAAPVSAVAKPSTSANTQEKPAAKQRKAS